MGFGEKVSLRLLDIFRSEKSPMRSFQSLFNNRERMFIFMEAKWSR